jgi:hypothetical protein
MGIVGQLQTNADNPSRLIDINSTPFEVIDTLPEFIQKKMKSSEEYAGRVQHSANMEEAEATQGNTPAKQPKPAILGGPGNVNNGLPHPDDIPFLVLEPHPELVLRAFSTPGVSYKTKDEPAYCLGVSIPGMF